MLAIYEELQTFAVHQTLEKKEKKSAKSQFFCFTHTPTVVAQYEYRKKQNIPSKQNISKIAKGG